MRAPYRWDTSRYHNGISYDATRNPGNGGRMVVKVPGSGPKIGVLTDFFTFTGNVNSYYMGANGLLVPSIVNTPRIEYAPAGGPVLGLLIEGSRTQQLVAPRDHTNAAWVKVTMTAAKDQTGPDGVANSASSLTATGAAATSLQTIVQAAVASTLSFDIKRLIGTGTIGIAQDGVTFTDVTAQINSSTYTRVTLTATQLNPVLGIQLGTSGDKIAVDFSGFEAGSFASSRIGSAVTRAADVASSLLGTAVISSVAGTFFCESDVLSTTSTSVLAALWNSGTGSVIEDTVWHYYNGTPTMNIQLRDGAAASTVLSNGATTTTMAKSASAFAVSSLAVSLNGAITSSAGTPTLPTGMETFLLGSRPAPTDFPFGHIRRLDYWPERKPNMSLVRQTALGPLAA